MRTRTVRSVEQRVPGGQPLGRRAWIGKTSTILASVAVAGSVPVSPTQADESSPLVGVWETAFLRDDVPQGTTPNRVPALFTADGGLVLGFRPGFPSHDSIGFGSHGLGQWAQTGDLEYAWTYTSYNWDDKFVLTSTSRYRVSVVLETDAFSGTFTGGISAPDGQPQNSLTGSVTGKRLFTAA
jgi:hypothetical protein